jgi:hypothetical protein
MKKRVGQVTKALTKDLEGYKQQSQDDFLRTLLQYTQRQIGFEKAKLEELLSVGASLGADHIQGDTEEEHQRPTETDIDPLVGASTLITPSRHSLR